MNLALILASASPRRRELLVQLDIPYQVMTSGFDEESVPTEGLTPEQWVQRLAQGKAEEVGRRLTFDALVLGADTTVVLAGAYFNKPADSEDAKRMLRQMSGRTHSVYTGLCLVESREGIIHTSVSDAIHTEVTFDTLTEETIAAYVATGEPLDKAGAYGIQGAALSFIPHIKGDYFNIVGLPLEATRQLLLPYYPNIAPVPPQPSLKSIAAAAL